MRFLNLVIVLLVLLFAFSIVSADTNAEQELLDKYLKKINKVDDFKKLGWLSATFQLDRINRNNNYNDFTNYESQNFSNTNLSWLNTASSFGLEVGMIFNDKIAFSLGGEYWLKFGENQSGSFDYTNSSGANITVTDLKSEMSIWGINTSISYYLSNPPTITNHIDALAWKVVGLVGYYQVNWDLWDGYQTTNLTTATYSNSNVTHKGSAPGFSLGMGLDYPLNIIGLNAGLDFSYFYLNFKNVAWYNTLDQEIVATYTTSPDSRVNLDFSGFRGKFELKRYFSW